MLIIENIRLAFSTIMANKMRSFLTMLGMIIGISAVVAISAMGNGGKYQIEKSMEQFGTNRLLVFMNWENEKNLRARDFLEERDIQAIKRIEGIEAITPYYENWTSIKVKDKYMDIVLVGANRDSQFITNVEILKGRFINDNDVNNYRNNIVISEKEARELFGSIDILGEIVTVDSYRGDIDFRIVGISKYEDNLFSPGMNAGTAQVYVPLSTVMKIFNESTYQGINMKVSDRKDMDRIGDQVIGLLERLHDNKDMYMVVNMEEMLEIVAGVIKTISRVLALIAGIALLVGGIGIMNIMLVSVSERVREIGIKKAIGARRNTILVQFLIESSIISLLGGIIGVAFGVGLSILISSLLDMPPIISVREVVFASLLSMTLGVVFGVYPANRAAKMDPIDALGHE